MNITLTIKWNELQQQLDLRNYYMGEAAKRNNIEADTMQSSEDDKELFSMFAKQACNSLISAVAIRYPHTNYSINDKEIKFVFEASRDSHIQMLSMLQQAILDYLVNEINMQWLLHRQPQMAQTNISLRGSLYQNVMQLFSRICNPQKLHRRATDLAGI